MTENNLPVQPLNHQAAGKSGSTRMKKNYAPFLLGVILLVGAEFVIVHAQGNYHLQRDGFTAAGGYLRSPRYQTEMQLGKNDFGQMQSKSYRMGRLTAVQLSEQPLPKDFNLQQNYPNPFNQTTRIRWRIAQATTVEIAIYSIHGRKTTTLFSGRQMPGYYQLQYDGTDEVGRLLPSGIYFCRLTAGLYQQVIKLSIVR